MRKLCYLSLMLLMLACNRNKNVIKQDVYVAEIDLTQTKNPTFSNVFSAIELLPLETAPNGLIGAMRGKSAIWVKGQYYIVIDRSFVIYIFDNKGRFISSSEHCIGPSAEQYYILQDVAWNEAKKTIDILQVQDRITSYDIHFNFISDHHITAKSEMRFSRMFPLDKTQYLLFDNTKKGLVWRYDINGETKQMKYPGLIASPTSITTPIRCYDDVIYFTPPEVNNYVFSYNAHDETFGKEAIFNGKGKGLNNEDISDLTSPKEISSYILSESNKYSLFDRLYNGKYAISTFIHRRLRYANFYNLETSANFSFKQYRDESYGFPNFFEIDGDELLSIVPASDILTFIDPELVSNKAALDTIDINDNPIILRYKLKI